MTLSTESQENCNLRKILPWIVGQVGNEWRSSGGSSSPWILRLMRWPASLPVLNFVPGFTATAAVLLWVVKEWTHFSWAPEAWFYLGLNICKVCQWFCFLENKIIESLPSAKWQMAWKVSVAAGEERGIKGFVLGFTLRCWYWNPFIWSKWRNLLLRKWANMLGRSCQFPWAPSGVLREPPRSTTILYLQLCLHFNPVLRVKPNKKWAF